MARNVEIKARVASIDAPLPRARALAQRDAELIAQDDTFFRVPHGRLKLREFADGSAEMIHYQRADTVDAKLSDYRRHLGVVLQDNFLFDGTVRENIAYSRPDASDEELRAEWKRQLSAAHPDRARARGLPEEFIAVAESKAAFRRMSSVS